MRKKEGERDERKVWGGNGREDRRREGEVRKIRVGRVKHEEGERVETEVYQFIIINSALLIIVHIQ